MGYMKIGKFDVIEAWVDWNKIQGSYVTSWNGIDWLTRVTLW